MDGLNLKFQILRQFRTQAEFCMKAGIREERLSKIIRGRNKPNKDEEMKIISTLGIPTISNGIAEPELRTKRGFASQRHNNVSGEAKSV